ncbi:AAA family ATPase [Streptomyces sp. OF3]|uniref:AAA family ATPase n=1 Tax=Streptomyces alkaliterrae TaxID=2213162 RepID=A0A5P0YT08_9ACTN|nr:AfsR/SARP family transcriptional regulator [Streptomyces alkaliterrae]MBB1253963.1 AAA family ATPase [Streptomyces alkaliterrae]MBB1260678.1 AAA family ATPase [Streptomyces alkaliterrae]MQS02747.1 AAA family ATPase [Streptomyces alkaliterrae]
MLGSVAVRCGDSSIRLPSTVARRVLAVLMLSPGEVLSTPRLAKAVWGSCCPATASNQVRKAVAQLRQAIPGAGDYLLTDGPNYRLNVGATESDLVEFNQRRLRVRKLVEDGADEPQVIRELQAALSLFRGQVAADVVDGDELESGLIRAAVRVVEERRLAVQKELIALRLRSSPPALVIEDLRDLVAQHPLAEDLRAQLMLALSLSGRQADALAEYAEIRTLLRDELGIDPDHSLAQVHEAVLRGETFAYLHAGAPPRHYEPHPATTQHDAGRRHVAPRLPEARARATCTLPHGLTDFVGRREELDALLRTARAGSRGSGPLLICVDGMGGIGKTALALHAAHQLAQDYPDGQFYVDLHGFSPNEGPREPAEVLQVLLRSLGTEAANIPAELDCRIAIWRARLADSRVLLLLDNAASEAQVVPLLPPGNGSLALVTSRRRLYGLDGTEPCPVSRMSAGDSRTLVQRLLGDELDPEATERLIAHCGGLPLALRLAAAKLRSRPTWTLSHLVERLGDVRRRTFELQAGDRSVRSVLRLSFDGLTEAQRHALCVLALVPDASVDAYEAAALLGTGSTEAELLLEELLDVNLLEQPCIGRYSLHVLVAGVTAGTEEFEQLLRSGERRSALRRLLDYHLAVSARSRLLLGRPDDRTAAGHETAPHLPEINSRKEATEICERESPAMLAVLCGSRQEEFFGPAAQLARNLRFVLTSEGCHVLGEVENGEEDSGEYDGVAAGPRETEVFRTELLGLAAACRRTGLSEQSEALTATALSLAAPRRDR